MTPDLANQSVTTPKIAGGAVLNTNLGPDVQARFEAMEASIASLQALVAAEAIRISELEFLVATLQGNPVMGLGPYVSVVSDQINDLDGPHLVFSGVNIHVRNGSGQSDLANGLGNLVLGYNESRGGGEPVERSASHMLISGSANHYSGAGGICVGSYNTVSGNGIVLGGIRNTATWSGMVLNGSHNTAASQFPVMPTVIGGNQNGASGAGSVVIGGYSNSAAGDNSTVSGGFANFAVGRYSSVGGGVSRSSLGEYDWAAGSLWEDQ